MIQYHLNPVLEELPFRTTKRDARTPSATAQDKYQKLKKKKGTKIWRKSPMASISDAKDVPLRNENIFEYIHTHLRQKETKD